MMITLMGVMIGRNRRGTMEVAQIILQTVITTIDLLIVIAAVFTKGIPDMHKKVIAALIMVNIAGVWL